MIPPDPGSSPLRWVTPRRPGRPGRPDPQGRAREILEERYAHGEIDQDEFLTRRRDLTAK
ncbi:MAG: SHOCT domain-containing protein [Actinomycetota bacterium]